MNDDSQIVSLMQRLDRKISRKGMLLGAGGTAVAAGAASMAVFGTKAGVVHASGTKDDTSGDTPAQIVTAALIAEDLATTFYYNVLVGPVIQDPNLAGMHGTATDTSPNPQKSNIGNVKYVRAALTQEIQHANLLRSVLGGSSASGDLVQTFYFPTGSFDTLGSFLGLLDALESAFIGAYMTAVQEFAQQAADTKAGIASYGFSSVQLEYFAKVSASILGVESEHRVLGRVIGGMDPANNLSYESTDGLSSVYNGSASAVAALTPFLTPGVSKTAYSFATALANASSVALASEGNPPHA